MMVGDEKMIYVPNVDENIYNRFDFPKVELHIHLDGAVRHSTLHRLSIEKEISLFGATTVEEVQKLFVSKKPSNLASVLASFNIYLPLIAGDRDAIELIAYELCEDEAKNGIIYFEARYSPHLLCNTVKNSVSYSSHGVYTEKGELRPREVIEAVKLGFDRGEKDFGVIARSILCCIHGFQEWNEEVLDLATKLSSEGVVGIDIAGCTLGTDEKYPPSVSELFKEAAKQGVHRTVHAGESGSAESVVRAVDEMLAERIGHGYRLLQAKNDYKKYAIEKRIHFETCPLSSVITGSVPPVWKQHPIKQFAADNINFSVNTDDPTCFGNSLLSEYQIAYEKIGLTKKQLWQCNLNAARSCFAEEPLKNEIISKVETAKI